MSSILLAILLVGVVFLRLLYESISYRKLPPGPRRIPFIGNIHQLTADALWLQYEKFRRKYGPIFSVQIAGTTHILIGDPQLARDVLDKRSAIDRPRLVMFVETVGRNLYTAFGRYTPHYQTYQRMISQMLSARAARSYEPVQGLEVRHALHELLSSNDFKKIFLRMNASVIFSLVYGKRIIHGEEDEMTEFNQRHANFLRITSQAWMVDLLPVLNYLPKIFAPWKQIADEIAEFETSVHLRNINRGLARSAWNWTKQFVGSKEAQTVHPIQLAYDIGMLIDAGLETTTAIMEVFTLAALTAPDAIIAAQKELDQHVGSDRLPCLEDRSHLPYVSALIQETQRWRPISPLLFPHAVLEDQEIAGYRIPQGAAIWPLAWSMSLDNNTFQNSDEFLPERWLEPSSRTQFSNHFGYGRRACSGRNIGENSVFLMIAGILWGFNIKNPKDQDVRNVEFTQGLLSVPGKFTAVFEPRSSAHRDVIVKAWDNSEEDISVVMKDVAKHQASLGIGSNVNST